MKEFTFKYYPARILLFLLCLVLTVLILVKGFFKPEVTFVNVSFWIGGSSGLLALIFTFLNKYGMWNWVMKTLGIPDVRGNYLGKLTSSYHINDDPNQPNITKYMKIEISQNLNGFYAKSYFYDSEFHSQESSSSESISHDIEPKDNGEYLIIYRYRNTGNNFHHDHKKYNLNKHDGIAQLYFNPANKTLIGKYFNDSQDRPSYGTINLNKIL